MLYRNKESQNIYTVCETLAPPADSACKESVVVLALQGKADGKPLDPDEMGTFQVFQSELDDEYEQVA